MLLSYDEKVHIHGISFTYSVSIDRSSMVGIIAVLEAYLEDDGRG